MALFQVRRGIVERLHAHAAQKERDIQRMFEKNLEQILEISFLASEYSTTYGRIDTLGIDRDGSPCIIEYKRGRNDNVINQGLSYLNWLLDHQSDFQIALQRLGLSSRRNVDWKSPRVICIAESFSRFDLDTAAVLPIRVELLRYEVYDDDLLLVEPASSTYEHRTHQVRNVSEELKKVAREVRQWTMEDHYKNASKETRKLFEALRERIITLNERIIEEPKAWYIAYKLATNFVDIHIQREVIKLWLNMPSGTLNDPLGLARDMTKPKKIGHWGNGDYEVRIVNDGQLDAVFALVLQSYERHK